MRIRASLALTLIALVLAGCGEAPKTAEAPKAAAPPEEPLTGRQAFQRMYPAARAWAVDAIPLQLKSIDLQDVKAEPGKAGAWQAIFVSPSRSKQKSWTYSTLESAGNLHQGTFAGPEDAWAGRSGQEVPFEIAAIRTDSDEAYKAALAKSEAYVKKNPGKPISFILEQTNRFPDVAWRVVWGASVSTSDYSVFIDAPTGKFLEIAH